MPVRKVYAPYSTSGEQIGQTPLQGYIGVEQEVRPIIDTGTIDEDGIWKGNVSSDTEFTIHKDAEELANGASFLTPSANADGSWPLDMTGYNDMFIAIKPTDAGDYAIQAVMGPDSLSFANLSPVNAAAPLKGLFDPRAKVFENLVDDDAESLTVNVWNIFYVNNARLADQKLLQFKITNNSGGVSTIETAFMRLV